MRVDTGRNVRHSAAMDGHIKVRVDTAEREDWRSEAERDDRSLSAWIRRACIAAAWEAKRLRELKGDETA